MPCHEVMHGLRCAGRTQIWTSLIGCIRRWLQGWYSVKYLLNGERVERYFTDFGLSEMNVAGLMTSS